MVCAWVAIMVLVSVLTGCGGGSMPAATRPFVNATSSTMKPTRLKRIAEIPTGWYVRDMTFSPDSRLLAAVGGYMNSLRSAGHIGVWDLQVHKYHRVTRGDHPYNLVAFTPDGRAVVAAGYSWVEVWDVKGTRTEELAGGWQRIEQIAISPNGKMLAAAGATALLPDGLSVYDISTGEKIRSFWGAAGRGVAFSSDSSVLAGSKGTQVKIWNTSTWETLAETSPPVTAKACCPLEIDRVLFVAGSNPLLLNLFGQVCLWDREEGRILWTMTSICSAFSDQGRHMAAIEYDRKAETYALTVREVSTGKMITSLDLGERHDIDLLSISPDGTLIAARQRTEDDRMNNDAGRIILWSTRD